MGKDIEMPYFVPKVIWHPIELSFIKFL